MKTLTQDAEGFGLDAMMTAMESFAAGIERDPVFRDDPMLWFAFFRVKGMQINEEADRRVDLEPDAKFVWRHTAKAVYRKGIETVIVGRILSWKKLAPKGKLHFNNVAKQLPLACQVLLFPEDVPPPPNYEETIRSMMQGLAELAGIRGMA